ncbi:MAG: ribosome maturation factor RimP [Gammaproteobacteria bacterium]|nr:ribosome maturation factor RimP [Gammaproteobacteria bacterium]
MAAVAENLTSMIEPVVEGLGYELLGIEYIPQGRHSILRLYIDSEKGIVLEDCERVSRQVSGVMDVEDPLKGQYLLEVSSPGLDRPLFKASHYMRHIGQVIKLRLRRPHEGQRKFRGELVSADESGILLRQADTGQETRLDYGDIEKANLEAEI